MAEILLVSIMTDLLFDHLDSWGVHPIIDAMRGNVQFPIGAVVR
jgi:hypothetical protein